MELWLPGADRTHRAPINGGTMVGGPPRAVWHTTEGDGDPVPTYKATTSWPTITWNPSTGHLQQHLPANVAARALQNPAGGVQTNRQGLVCVQIEVVGHAAKEPLRIGAFRGFATLIAWLRQLGIPNVWPAGNPLPYPRSYGLGNGDRFPSLWLHSGGHYGHSQVPENHHGDPGPVAMAKWSPAPAPKPTTHVPAFPRERGDDQVIKRGDRGAEVVAVQRRLHDRGWRIGVDGVFGATTEGVVVAFQRDKHLTADGEVGAKTWAALWTTPTK